MFSILIGIGFAKDTSDLTSTTYESMRKRKWRMSYLAPYAANLRAVLYQCADDKKITIFINDAPLYIKQFDCTLCSWDKVGFKFDQIMREIFIEG